MINRASELVRNLSIRVPTPEHSDWASPWPGQLDRDRIIAASTSFRNLENPLACDWMSVSGAQRRIAEDAADLALELDPELTALRHNGPFARFGARIDERGNTMQRPKPICDASRRRYRSLVMKRSAAVPSL